MRVHNKILFEKLWNFESCRLVSTRVLFELGAVCSSIFWIRNIGEFMIRRIFPVTTCRKYLQQRWCSRGRHRDGWRRWSLHPFEWHEWCWRGWLGCRQTRYRQQNKDNGKHVFEVNSGWRKPIHQEKMRSIIKSAYPFLWWEGKKDREGERKRRREGGREREKE